LSERIRRSSAAGSAPVDLAFGVYRGSDARWRNRPERSGRGCVDSDPATGGMGPPPPPVVGSVVAPEGPRIG